MNSFLFFVFICWISMVPRPSAAQERDRELYFPAYYFYAERRLMNHTIKKVLQVKNLDECEYLCYMEDACVSLNIKNKDPGSETHECELNNSTYMEHGEDLKTDPLYYYRGAKNNCGKSGGWPCKNNATCKSGFTYKGYRCSCTPGFEGEQCDKDVDECTKSTPVCDNNAVCNNTHGGYNCTCKPGYTGDGHNCTDVNECDRGSYKCHVNATCINTKGSYNCSCKKGYSGNGHNCTDVDECATGNHNCNERGNEVCINTKGSFSCRCAVGFVKNGGNCEADKCQDYQILNNTDRKYEFASALPYQCDQTLPIGWYRFQGAAGTQMATTCPPPNRCGANFPVWLSDGHPTVAEGIVKRQVCFHKSGNCCKEKTYIEVKNCGSYFIYKLLPIVSCNSRYCGAD